MLIKFSDRFYYTKQRYMYLEPALGYVKGEYFSVMLDSGNGPAQVENFLNELKENDLPMPSYVILTHHHWDHSFGAAYLDIPVIATDRARDSLIELSQLEWDKESLYQRVKDGTEIKYSADVIRRVYENHEIKIRIPDMPKMADFNLNLGKIKLNCLYNDNSHSNDAFLIYIPEEKVLFLGDSHAKNYYTKPMAYNKQKLRDYIDKITELDFEHAVPGHGNIFSREELLEYLEKEYAKMRWFYMNLMMSLDWVLLITMSLAFCQQLFSKKFNFFGVLSLLSLATYIALHSYSTGLSIFILLIFIGGIALIGLEMFIPGGIVGTVGVVTLVYAIIYVNKSTYYIAFILVISLILAVILYYVNRNVFHKKLMFLDRLVLNDSISTKDGYVASESRLELLGQKLIAYTDLRPAGVAVLENEKLDVVTDGDFVEKGNKIEVIRVEGMRIVVKKI